MAKKPVVKARKKQLNYVSFKEVPGLPAFGLLVAICFTGFITLVNLFFGEIRSFYLWLFPPLSIIRVTTTLWRLSASSACFGITKGLREFCRKLVGELQGASIHDYSLKSCAYESMLLNTVDLGCNSSVLLGTGSLVFAFTLIIGSGMQACAAVLLVVWWFKQRTLRIRYAVVMVLAICPIMEIIGIGSYVSLIQFRAAGSTAGGVLSLGHLVGPSGMNSQNVPLPEIEYGFFVAIGCMLLSAGLAVGGSAALRRDCCVDWEESFEEEEQELLLDTLEKYLLEDGTSRVR